MEKETGIPIYLEKHKNGSLILIKLVPSAKHDQIVGLHDDRLKITLTAPPVDGKANKAIVEFLAKKLGISKSLLEITAGKTSRRKTILASGLSPEEIATGLRF